MKPVYWIIKLLLFLAALTFAVKNTDPIIVRYYLGLQWQAPLIFVILAVFCIGAVAGVVSMLGYLVRLRREVSRLRKQVAAVNTPVDTTVQSAVPRIADAL